VWSPCVHGYFQTFLIGARVSRCSEWIKFLNFPRSKNAQLAQASCVPMRPPFRGTCRDESSFFRLSRKRKMFTPSLKTKGNHGTLKTKYIDAVHTLFSRPSLSWSSPLTVAGDVDTPEPWGYCPKRSNDDISRAVVQDCGAGHLDTEKPRVVEEWLRRRWTCWHGCRRTIERDRENRLRTAAVAVGERWHGTRISSRCCRCISGCERRWKEIAPSQSVAGVIPTNGVSRSLLTRRRPRAALSSERACVRARTRPHPYRSGSVP